MNAFPALLALFDTSNWQSNSTFVQLSHKFRQRQMLKEIQTDLLYWGDGSSVISGH